MEPAKFVAFGRGIGASQTMFVPYKFTSSIVCIPYSKDNNPRRKDGRFASVCMDCIPR
jgi:hypothetical protein